MEDDTALTRTLRTLELIQAQPGITGEAIARRLGVTTRATRRQVATLRAAGFAIDSTPGPGGGYRLSRGGRMPLVFTAEELLSLAMALCEAPGAGGDDIARSAAAKVLRAIPQRVAAPAQAVLEAATTIPAAHDVRPDPRVVLALASAMDQARRLELTYRSAAEGGARRIVVEPWAMVIRHGRWYLLGQQATSQATRTYRLDRMADVVLLDEVFTPPAELDPTAAFEEHLRTSWRHATRVDIAAPLAEVRPWIPPTMGILSATGSQSCRLEGRTNNCAGYALDLLRTPFAFTVVDGPELRQACRELASRLGA